MGKKLLELLQSSVIISGALALGIAGAIVYLAVTGQPIPDVLATAFATIIGFFFGARQGRAEAERVHK